MNFKVIQKVDGKYKEVSFEEAIKKKLIVPRGNTFFASSGVIILKGFGVTDNFGNEIFESDIILKGDKSYIAVFNPYLLQFGYAIEKEFYTFNDDLEIPLSVIGNMYISSPKKISVIRNFVKKKGGKEKVISFKSNYQVKE